MRGGPRFGLGLSLLASGLFLAFGGDQAAAGGPVLECTLVVNAASGETLSRKGICDQAHAPQSTFKFPLALMGYDSGVLEDAKTPTWDYKPEFQASKREQKTVNPTIWLGDSILWYSRQITRKLGEARFADYVTKFNYGNMDVSGQPRKNNGLTHSWLMSSLKISPEQQVRFVRAVLDRRLPVSAKAYDMTQAILPTFETYAGWSVHGKTGSGWLRDAAGDIDKNRPLGWFVGWAEREGQRVVFARLEIGSGKSEVRPGIKARDMIFAELSRLSDR